MIGKTSITARDKSDKHLTVNYPVYTLTVVGFFKFRVETRV